MPTRLPIDARNFRAREWKRPLEKVGVEYRLPYTLRRTFASRSIRRDGWTLPQAAKMTGHTDTRMVADPCRHLIERPRLPEFQPLPGICPLCSVEQRRTTSKKVQAPSAESA